MDLTEVEAPEAPTREARPAKAPLRDWVPGFALRDAWFPLAHSESVSKRAVKRLVHSQPFYLWRDDKGVPHASEFHPLHFDAMRGQASEFTAGTGEYPVIETFGYVWGWYGDPAHA